MKIIIDCNIWISFLIGHQTRLVQRILADKRYDVYMCDRLIEEIRDVASREKILRYVSFSDVDDLLSIIHAFCLFVNPKIETPPSAVRDPKDLYLLSLAETIGADYIVGGDADLADLQTHKQTSIIKLSAFGFRFIHL